MHIAEICFSVANVGHLATSKNEQPAKYLK